MPAKLDARSPRPLSGELRDELALSPPQLFGPIRRVGDTWYFTAKSDRSEPEHRVDFLAGRLYCSCTGFVVHGHCKHSDYVRRKHMNGQETHLIVSDHPPGSDMPDVWRSPTDLARRLDDLRHERSIVQSFFKDIMVKDEDFGIIPGTDKPTLYKAGAEKLCELYGYAPIVADIQETTDYETGHYRVVIRLALVHKGSGVKVAEGVGECNTREARYCYRWVFDNEVPAGVKLESLKAKEFKRRDGKGTFKKYRLENEDLFSLWNTILKMGKKRALVDATLSATRSSGLFTQSAEHLDEWIEGEFEDVTTPTSPADDDGGEGAGYGQPAAAPVNDAAQRPSADAGSSPASSPPADVQAPTRPAPPTPPPAPTPGPDGGLNDWWAATRKEGIDRKVVMAKSAEMFDGKEPMHISAEERGQLLHALLEGTQKALA